MTKKLFLNCLIFWYYTTVKMEQISTLFCSITLFNLDSLMFKRISSSIMNNFTTLFKNFQGIAQW